MERRGTLNERLCCVLILLLMEYGHGDPLHSGLARFLGVVLILLLMEYGHGAVQLIMHNAKINTIL